MEPTGPNVRKDSGASGSDVHISEAEEDTLDIEARLPDPSVLSDELLYHFHQHEKCNKKSQKIFFFPLIQKPLVIVTGSLYRVSQKNVFLSHKNVTLDQKRTLYLNTAQQNKQLLRTFLWDTRTSIGHSIL